MKISYDIYNVFYYVAKFKSITLAAKYLHVSQPAVTRQIKNLEKNLGATLFIRNSHGLDLTKAGNNLYQDVSQAIEIFNSIESKFNEYKPLEEGSIKILSGNATAKNILLPIIKQYNKLHPKIKVYIEHYPYAEAISKLRNGEVDILLMNTEDLTEYSDIYSSKFCTVSDILVVNSEMKDQYPKTIKLEEITQYPIICKKGFNNARSFITELLKKKNIEFKPAWELTSYWLIEEYIKMSMGIGIVCREFVQKYLDDGTLIELKTDIVLPKRGISYVVRKNCLLRPELIGLMHLFDHYSK